MKLAATVFLRAVLGLIGIGALTFLLWEPLHPTSMLRIPIDRYGPMRVTKRTIDYAQVRLSSRTNNCSSKLSQDVRDPRLHAHNVDCPDHRLFGAA